MGKKIKIVVVCGPTATGKTELAFALCRRFGGELIGADSMQVYEGLPVGTAAPLPSEHADVPRHLIACLPPQHLFSVADYLQRADVCIRDVAQRNRLPVLCGGTGQYIDGIVSGIHFSESTVPKAALQELEERWEREGALALWEQLKKRDPACADKLHLNDKKRIMRALAEVEQNGSTLAERNAHSRERKSDFEALVLVLCDEERQNLYQRIEYRVDCMLQAGLLQEVQWVHKNKERFKTAVQAIGYKELFPYIEGDGELKACVDALKQATRRYAKRQQTWFRNHTHNVWLFPDKEDVNERAVLEVERFLNVP